MDKSEKSKFTSKNNKFNHKTASNKTINRKEKAKVQHKETAEELTVGDNIVVTIKRIGINGEGVGYYRRKAVFVNGALPGEVVKAKVTRSENKFIEALIQHVEKKSADVFSPPAPFMINVVDVKFNTYLQRDKR